MMLLSTLLGALFATVSAAPTAQLLPKEQSLAPRDAMPNAPFRFPLPNGFPNVTSEATLKAIEQQAGGPLPDGSGMGTISNISALALQAVAFNELFEVAFFTELLHNVTNSVPGYELGVNRAEVIAAINSSQAQEELHLLSANAGLKASNFAEIQPCAYNFPVSTFEEAMRMADNFSGLLVGVIGALLDQFAAGGDSSDTVTTLFCAVLAQEGQQDGFFRFLQSKVPNANGWLTSTTLSYVYNHIKQHYVAPGSCPQAFNFPDFATLTPLTAPGPVDTTVSFSTTQKGVDSSHYIAYMSGQIYPVVVAISDIAVHSGGLTTFKASFPYVDMDFSRGLTVVALVSRNGSYTDAADVAAVTLAGPALLQVD